MNLLILRFVRGKNRQNKLCYFHFVGVCLCLCVRLRFPCTAHSFLAIFSVKYWTNFLLLWIRFIPYNVICDQMVMMMVALYFNRNVNRFYNGLRMEMSMMFNWNMDTDSSQMRRKKKKSVNKCSNWKENTFINSIQKLSYLEPLA